MTQRWATRGGRTLAVFTAITVTAVIAAGPSEGSAGTPSLGTNHSEDDAAAGEVEFVSDDEAERRDAETIAEKYGESVSVVHDRLRSQQRFGRLVSGLSEADPDTYAGGWSTTDSEGRPTFFVKYVGEVPARAREAAQRHNLEPVFLSDAQYSEAEFQVRADQLHEDLIRNGHPGVGTGYSVSEQRIIGTAKRGERHRGVSDEELRNRLPERSRASDVHITFIDGAVGGYTHSRGGAWMWDSSQRQCTSGFSVKRRSDNLPGVVTAGHCPGLSKYEEPGLTPYSASPIREHRGSYGDVEWLTTSHGEYAEFHATSSEIRNVSYVESASAVAENDDYCAYGRKTNKKRCDKVWLVNHKVTFDGFTHERLTVMRNFQADFGDSGGPWFWGTTAAGVHSGWANINGGKYETWSKVGNLGSALDVYVFTK